MFFAAGVSAYGAAIFHLMTHAFFKALLFLGSGSVIHAMSGEQDMRKMGGLARRIPVTHAVMVIGSLALAGIGIPGVFGFAGFYSKDTILEAAWSAHSFVGTYAFCLGVFAAFITAFYSWRLLIMTFYGESRAERSVQEHIHESPQVMLIPLYVLAIGAVFAGRLGFDWFVGEARVEFWRESILVLQPHDTIEGAHHAPLIISLLPTIAAILGIAVAYYAYMIRPELPAEIVARFRALYLFLLNKWYFDELYDRIFVQPAFRIGWGLWKGGDGAVIDGLGPDGLAATTQVLARRVSRLQTGYLYHYAFAILIGVVALVSWLTTGPEVFFAGLALIVILALLVRFAPRRAAP
jgi:NADH-quinone oxidoreductase subunit L